MLVNSEWEVKELIDKYNIKNAFVLSDSSYDLLVLQKQIPDN